MANKVEVKYQDHFKLYIEFKDNIIFENELLKNSIDYYRDEESITVFRYYLLDKDNIEIDKILQENNIFASNESLQLNDFKTEKKFQLIYLKIIIIVILILLIVEFLNS